MGSATPSLESYARALKGVYGLTELKERVNRQLERAYLDRIDAWQVRRYKQLVGEIINILRGFPENELNRQLEDLYLMGYELQRNAFFTKNDTTNHTEEE